MKPFVRVAPVVLIHALLPSCDPERLTEGGSGSSDTSTGAAGESSGTPVTTAVETTSAATGSSSEADDHHEAESSGESSATESTGDEPSVPGEVPKPSAPCPELVDGWVTFCPASIDVCRDAIVVNSGDADGSGPLEVQWHGTYESPDGYLDWDYATGEMLTMIGEENGLMVLPAADPEALGPDDPFPWFIVCVGNDCDRPDDFVLFDEIAACAVDQGLVDPDRIVTSGMSAGGIMVSHLVETVPWLAGAVSWSGGQAPFYRPTEPAGEFPVMTIHGGTSDLFGGYSFYTASLAMADDVAERGSLSILCDHGNGHVSTWLSGVAPFMALARRGEPHPFADYSFGNGGEWSLDMYCELVEAP